MTIEKFIFYATSENEPTPSSGEIAHGLSMRLWKPTWWDILPPLAPWNPYALWWVMHYLRVFSSRDYSVLLVMDGDRVIHRSCIFPRYFRFPFMKPKDLQVGYTWTADEYRGRGIASMALKKILDVYRKPGRRFWYVAPKWNTPSIRVADKVGLVPLGEGTRLPRWRLWLFGKYEFKPDYAVRPNDADHPWGKDPPA